MTKSNLERGEVSAFLASPRQPDYPSSILRLPRPPQIPAQFVLNYHLAEIMSPRLNWRHLEHLEWQRPLLVVLPLLAWIFLLLVEIGTVSNRPVVRSTFFLRLNMANIIPISVGGGATLVNSIARTIGLHDFYTVGLWSFCEGYDDTGISDCSRTRSLFWFNPVAVVVNELLAGASVALPAEIYGQLGMVRVASWWAFGLFMAAVVLSFLVIFLTPLAWTPRNKVNEKSIPGGPAAGDGAADRAPTCVVDEPADGITTDRAPDDRSHHFPKPSFLVRLRGRALPATVLLMSVIATILTLAAAIVASALFSRLASTLKTQPSINIGAELGGKMFSFMWLAVFFHLCSLVAQLVLCWDVDWRRWCGWCRCVRRWKKTNPRAWRWPQRGARSPPPEKRDKFS